MAGREACLLRLMPGLLGRLRPRGDPRPAAPPGVGSPGLLPHRLVNRLARRLPVGGAMLADGEGREIALILKVFPNGFLEYLYGLSPGMKSAAHLRVREMK